MVDVRHAAAAAIFAVTFLLLALGRIGTRKLPRGPVALAGGAVTVLVLAPEGFLSWQVWTLIDWQVIALLAGLMVLAGLGEAAGLFAGLRRHLIRLPPALALWSCLAVVAATSALLLNDAAVVVFVPFLLPLVLTMQIPAVPAVTLMACAANIGSLLTPFGNPQNAVLARAGDLSMLDFLRVQTPLVVVGMVFLGGASWWVTRNVVRVEHAMVPPAIAVGRPWVIFAIAVFLALAITSSGMIGLGGAAVIAATIAYLGLRIRIGRTADNAAWRGLDWNVLLLFFGLYWLTSGLGSWFPSDRLPLTALSDPLRATAGMTVLSNTVGNVPAVLAFQAIDPQWTAQHAMFLVSASTLGGALLLTGSAASLLTADAARRSGVEVRFLAFARTAVPWTLPLLLLAAMRTWHP